MEPRAGREAPDERTQAGCGKEADLEVEEPVEVLNESNTSGK